MSMSSQFPELLDPATLPFPYPRVSLTVRGRDARVDTMPPVSNEPRRVLLVHGETGVESAQGAVPEHAASAATRPAAPNASASESGSR